MKINKNIISLLLLCVTVPGLTLAGVSSAPAAKTDIANSLASIQKQMQTVSDSIPVQIEAAQATNQKEISGLQQTTQAQLSHLQTEIDQLQAQNQTTTGKLQKEIEKLQSNE